MQATLVTGTMAAKGLLLRPESYSDVALRDSNRTTFSRHCFNGDGFTCPSSVKFITATEKTSNPLQIPCRQFLNSANKSGGQLHVSMESHDSIVLSNSQNLFLSMADTSSLRSLKNGVSGARTLDSSRGSRRRRTIIVFSTEGRNTATALPDEAGIPENGSSTSYSREPGSFERSAPNAGGTLNNGEKYSDASLMETMSQEPVDEISIAVMNEVADRLQRLQILVLLRRLYRDVVRSERILVMPLPNLAVETGGEEEPERKMKKVRRKSRDWLGREWRRKPGESGDVELIANNALEVFEFAEDIREVAFGLKRVLAGFEGHLADVFRDDRTAEQVVVNTVSAIAARLEKQADRVESILSPEDREKALELKEGQSKLELEENSNVQARLLRRLESLPDTSLFFDRFKRNISSVDLSRFNLNIIQRQGLNVVRTVEAVWRRLNGWTDPSQQQPFVMGLPRPSSVRTKEEEKKLALILEVEALDKKLGEVSRMREQRVRQKNVLARTRLASEIRSMDDEVNEIRKELAVRTLQVEMALIYLTLEAELLDTSGSEDVRTDEEESLLVAEFGLLDADLARLRISVDRREAILVDDEELEVLATDIPDLKSRLGIMEDASIPVNQRAALAFSDGVTKIQAGSSFYLRGMRLLGGDISYSLRLFWAAVTGTTLKPREVQTVRRTAKDVLVLIPFSIILIAPITPVGHVLVFSFLQKYFPGFFPSSFSAKRQEVMKRYELIKNQLEAASDPDKEEAQARAAAAATETFEAFEEESPVSGHGLKVTNGKRRTPRRLKDELSNFLLLEEKLPDMARVLSTLKGSPPASDWPRKDQSSKVNSKDEKTSPILSKE